MDWGVTLGIALFLLLAMFATGAPVFIAFLVINVGGTLWLMGTSGFGLFANSVYETLTSESLTTIALFVLMGELLFRSGSVDVIFDALDKLLGKIKGRLYAFVIALSALFGALSGSAVAVAAMLSRSALPTMQQRGYDTGLSIGLIVGGASLAPIIPPSLMVIIIGSMVDVSISSLLIAGIVPGILIAVLFAVYVGVRLVFNPSLAPAVDDTPKYSLGVKFRALLSMAPFSIIIFSVLGFIMLGIATPSESAATGVAGALLISAYYRKLSMKMVWGSVTSSLAISAMILTILASSKLFSQLLAFTGATSGLVKTASSLGLEPMAMLFILMLIPFLACIFIDQIAFMMVAIPIYAPLLKVYGYDPVWFWTLFLINIAIGSVTPPFGYNLFAVKGAAPSVPIQTIFRSAWPIVGVFVFSMLLIAIFPGFATALPGMF